MLRPRINISNFPSPNNINSYTHTNKGLDSTFKLNLGIESSVTVESKDIRTKTLFVRSVHAILVHKGRVNLEEQCAKVDIVR